MKCVNMIRYQWRRRIASRLLCVILLGFMVLAIGGAVKGQTYLHDSLTAYLELAARNNPTVQAKFNEYLAALERVPQAGGLPDPELSFGIFIKPMAQVNGSQVADFQIMQMFPWLGALSSARDEASLMAKAKYEAFREVKQVVFFNLRKEWMNLYLNQKRIEIVQDNLDILKTIERIAITRFSSSSGSKTVSVQRQPLVSAGMPVQQRGMNAGASSSGMQGGMSDESNGSGIPGEMNNGNPMGSMDGTSGLITLYRIQIEMGDLENSLADWISKTSVLEASVNSLLNRHPATPIYISDTLIQDSLTGTLQMIRNNMMTQNTMLTMLGAEKSAFDERIRMTKRMSYPMFGVGVDYMLMKERPGVTSDMNGMDMIMPMGKITIPIYRGKYKAMRKEAEFLSLSVQSQISATENMLSVEYSETLRNLEDASRSLKLFTRQAALAEKTLTLMISEFSVSGAGFDELLKIRQQLLDYEFRKEEAVVDYNTAIAGFDRLMAASGSNE